MPGNKIKVVLADDNLIVREAVRRLLENSPNISVVGEANNGQEAIDLFEDLLPDILILDINMPVMDGIQVLKVLRQKGHKAAVIILSGMDDITVVAESMQCGAHSFILKDDDPFSIRSAVDKAFRGERGIVSKKVAQYQIFL